MVTISSSKFRGFEYVGPDSCAGPLFSLYDSNALFRDAE